MPDSMSLTSILQSRAFHEYKAYLIILLIVFSLRWLVVNVYRRRKHSKERDNFIIGINNLTFLLLIVVGFFLILQFFGVTIREFFTSITIFAAALAIVFKDYILNGLNGMLLMFGDNMQIGDYVQIGIHKGRIDNITLLNVHLLNDEEDLVIIPNNTFVNTDIINFSKNPKHHSSIDFEVQSSQLINVADLEKKLNEILLPFQSEIREGSIKLRVIEFKKDIVHYRFRFGLINYDSKRESVIKQSAWSEIIRLINQSR